MTTSSNIPTKWTVPWANGDSSKVEIPVTSSDSTRASLTLGFPPLTMQPPESGGVPPQGEDFNGGMNQIARIAWWVMQGGGFPYDSTFATSTNIGGYPNGALLPRTDLTGFWVNQADSNTTNPDAVDGTAANWIPLSAYGTTALTAQTGGTVTVYPMQAAREFITVAGTLTSNLILQVPTWVKRWTVTNNTSGSYTVTVKTATGSGIVVPQNGSPTALFGDGTNVTQPAQNIAAGTSSTHAIQFGQATGRLLNIRYLTGSGTYTPTSGTTSIVFDMLGGGGAGGGAPATASNTYSCGGGGGAGSFLRKRLTTGFSSVSYSVGAGGTAASGAKGGTGGSSTFSTYSAAGGTGGDIAGAAAQLAYAAGGAGSSTPSDGDLVYQGAVGSLGLMGSTDFAVGGNGGGSVYGTGGGGAGGAAGSTGTGYGTGGGGASAGGGTGAFAGGAGTAGVIVVYEYA